MKPQFSKHTLFNYFSGNATPLQKKAIEEWVGEAANRELFFEWLKEWENEHPQVVADPELAFARFQAKRAGGFPASERVPAPVVERSFRTRWMVAASIVLALGFAGWFFRDRMQYQYYQTAYGEIRTLTLPDSSQVVLNANSSLRVPRFGFGPSTREVLLIGEAAFSVKHTPTHQRFIVHTPDQLDVEVLGTEFVVYARERGSRVSLEQGKVQLKNAAQESLAIRPGEVVTLDQKGHFQKNAHRPVKIYSAWKENRFVFDRTPLLEVTHLIAENFGVQVLIPDTLLAQQSISGTFRAENAQEMLHMIADITGIQVKRDGEKVILLPAFPSR